jgi:hypothetical protein
MIKIRQKITPFNAVLSVFLIAGIIFSVIQIIRAAAPNPGHNFTEVSGSVAQGDILYGSAADTLSALAKDTTDTRYLSNTGASNNPAWAANPTFVVLAGDVINANATANTIADVTGLSFPVTAGKRYHFKFIISYTSAAATTGSRWSINGPASPTFLAYAARYTLTAITCTATAQVAYDLPAAANATSLLAGNAAVIEGVIVPSVDGTVIARFASEIASSAITAKAGSTLVYWVQ